MNTEMMEQVESNLRLKLKPFQPSPEFVDHLKNRLTNPVSMEVESPSNKTASFIYIAAGFALVTIVIYVIRKLSSK